MPVLQKYVHVSFNIAVSYHDLFMSYGRRLSMYSLLGRKYNHDQKFGDLRCQICPLIHATVDGRDISVEQILIERRPGFVFCLRFES